MATVASTPNRWTEYLRASGHLTWFAIRRQSWSLSTLIALVLVGMVAVLVFLHALWKPWTFDLFSEAIIGGIYISFLLPLLALSIGTHAIGGDWEERNLIWLLVRPLPRPLIYTAKFLGAIPWALGLTLGSLALLGALAGMEGLRAVAHAIPAVVLGTLAYLSAFVLMGAAFRRSTVIAVVYSFVLETFVGNLPGLIKRGSIGFYIRCLVPQAGVEKPELFFPVSEGTAFLVLGVLLLGLFVLGIMVFARREYHDLTG